MRFRKGRRLGLTATLGAAALAASMAVNTGIAGAITIPNFPTNQGQYPSWLTTNNSISNIIRGAGSDTTLFLMQQISDLYNQAGLYGCTPLGSGLTATAFCDTTGTPPLYSDTTTTDLFDNFDRTEVLQGVGQVGSSNGQKQLCGTLNSPQAVDFARSSKPAGSIAGCTMYQLGYAKDMVPLGDFQNINPGGIGAASYFQANVTSLGALTVTLASTATATADSSAGLALASVPSWVQTGAAVTGVGIPSGTTVSSISGNTITLSNAATTTATELVDISIAFPSSGQIGPVAAGWIPGDVTNCVAKGSGLSGTPCSGTAFSNVSNADGLGGNGALSTAYRLYCANDTSRITDWGQLTNLSAANNGGTAEPVGYGAPIGVPVNIVGINTGSGTVATFSSYANSGVSGGLCSGANVSDGNAASGPNPLVNNGPTGNTEIAVENNASQVGDFAAANFPNDPADQAVQIASSLYFVSYGAAKTNSNAASSNLTPGTASLPAGTPTKFTLTLMNENGQKLSTPNEGGNVYPTARTLFNIYRPDTIRATTGGFLNWICDNQQALQKQKDLVTGKNYEVELNSLIQNTFGFLPLDDTAQELPAASLTPADGVTAPNASCEAQLSMDSNGTSTLTQDSHSYYTTIPPGLQQALTQATLAGTTIPVYDLQGNIPSGTTLVSVNAAADQITLSNPVTSYSGAETIYFQNVAPVLQVSITTK